eukprot:CAMPEP_0178412192 /NCGR_PEP_ID=MMETSP0689_2-20121128/21885_1 /TAXON_ID=160604 /ORGANISM="Amphidinium massartii, Strain CS-259" /LENGTH=908 /DNA_ID=CAMNT_0020033425 /DNA_START=1 /DNA_END=2727 /DNA_ORIENTATION=-
MAGGGDGLRQCLADVREERDSAKATLERLRKAADFYRRAICNGLTRSGSSQHEVRAQLRDLARAMESEVSGSASRREQWPPSPTKTYEVLRQSLDEAQKRCESLNFDMVHQAEANEDLMDTLSHTKDSNHRLLDQIRLQTDEIAQLTQQRIGIEEQMDQLTHKHAAERDTARDAVQQRVEELRRSSADQLSSTREHLRKKLMTFQGKLQAAGTTVAKLLEEQQSTKLQAVSMQDGFQDVLQSGKVQLLSRCSGATERRVAVLQNKKTELRSLEQQLQHERKARQSEGLAWSQRYASLAADKEEVQAHNTREVSELTAQIQALERMLAAERGAWDEDKRRLHQRQQDASKRKASLATELEASDRRLGQLEEQEKAVQAENAVMEGQVVKELRSHARELDDELASALSANEHLRRQMEEQRTRLREKSEMDMREAQAHYDKKIFEAQHCHDDDTALQSNELQVLEAEVKAQEEAIAAVHQQLAQLADESEHLLQESSSLRSRSESDQVAGGELEKNFATEKRSTAMQRIDLQSGIEELAAETADGEQEIRRVLLQLEELRRSAILRETEGTTKIEAADAALRDGQTYLAVCQRKLADAEDAKRRCDADSSSFRQRATEIQSTLQQALESKKKAFDAEGKRLRDELSSETALSSQMRAQLDDEQERIRTIAELAADESRTKIDLAQREKARMEQSCQSEVGAAREEVLRHRRRAEALESDLSRMSSLLQESEANSDWVRQELDRADHEAEATAQLLGNDMRSALTELERAAAEEQRISQQVEAQCVRNEQDRMALLQDIDEIWPEAKPFRVGAGQKLAPQPKAFRSSGETPAAAAALDNSSTMMILTPEKPAYTGLSSTSFPQLHSKLEDHIQRLQRQTDELRQTHNQVVAAKADSMMSAQSLATRAVNCS